MKSETLSCVGFCKSDLAQVTITSFNEMLNSFKSPQKLETVEKLEILFFSRILKFFYQNKLSSVVSASIWRKTCIQACNFTIQRSERSTFGLSAYNFLFLFSQSFISSTSVVRSIDVLITSDRHFRFQLWDDHRHQQRMNKVFWIHRSKPVKLCGN